MRMLLTSAGVRNPALRLALAGLLGLPFDRARLVVVTTAATATDGDHGWLLDDLARLRELGWARISLLELNGLPADVAARRLRQADVLYLQGGNGYHVARSLHDTGLAGVVRDLVGSGVVYVGSSAGSMVTSRAFTARLTAAYGTGDDLYQAAGGRAVSPLDLVDWWLQPHADPATPDRGLADRVGCPVYAIDDDSAVRVDGASVDVVGDGWWTLLEPGRTHAVPGRPETDGA